MLLDSQVKIKVLSAFVLLHSTTFSMMHNPKQQSWHQNNAVIIEIDSNADHIS